MNGKLGCKLGGIDSVEVRIRVDWTGGVCARPEGYLHYLNRLDALIDDNLSEDF